MEFPFYVYKSPGHFECQGGTYNFATVSDEDEMAQMHEAGWFNSVPEALEGKPAAAAVAEIPADDAPPTRAELEAKAAELGIKADGVSDKKLTTSIAKKLG